MFCLSVDELGGCREHVVMQPPGVRDFPAAEKLDHWNSKQWNQGWLKKHHLKLVETCNSSLNPDRNLKHTLDGCKILHQFIQMVYPITHRVLIKVVQDFFHPQWESKEPAPDSNFEKETCLAAKRIHASKMRALSQLKCKVLPEKKRKEKPNHR